MRPNKVVMKKIPKTLFEAYFRFDGYHVSKDPPDNNESEWGFGCLDKI